MSFSPVSFPLEKVQGLFIHRETKARFEFAFDLTGEVHPYNEKVIAAYPMVIFLDEGRQTRRVRLSKTRAYVLLGENNEGELYVETWPIKYDWQRKQGE